MCVCVPMTVYQPVYLCVRVLVQLCTHGATLNVFPRWYEAGGHSQVSTGCYQVFLIYKNGRISWTISIKKISLSLTHWTPSLRKPPQENIQLIRLHTGVPFYSHTSEQAAQVSQGYCETQSINVFDIFLRANDMLSPTRRTKDQEGHLFVQIKHLQTRPFTSSCVCFCRLHAAEKSGLKNDNILFFFSGACGSN